MTETALSLKVRQRADRDHLPSDHDLRVAADKFDEAVNAEPRDVRLWLARWSKLRRMWCEYSGESLI